MAVDLPMSLTDLARLLPPSTRVSVHVIDLSDGSVLMTSGAERVLSSASMGKILALIDLAERAAKGDIDLSHLLSRTTTAPVGDSGLWQHLTTEKLPLEDIAALVGATSDNLAANVLIEHLGLSRIQTRAHEYGLTAVELHDLVRDHRRPEHSARLSSANSAELVGLLGRLRNDRETTGDNSPGARVLNWLSLNVDLSMVSSAFGLDPLAHRQDARRIRLASKTGTDVGVRADMGLVECGRSTIAYSVIVNWHETHEAQDRSRDDVLRFMRAVGEEVLQHLDLT